MKHKCDSLRDQFQKHTRFVFQQTMYIIVIINEMKSLLWKKINELSPITLQICKLTLFLFVKPLLHALTKKTLEEKFYKMFIYIIINIFFWLMNEAIFKFCKKQIKMNISPKHVSLFNGMNMFLNVNVSLSLFVHFHIVLHLLCTIFMKCNAIKLIWFRYISIIETEQSIISYLK